MWRICRAEVRVAFLPLALVETYLRALERPGRDVLRAPAEIAPLTRVCEDCRGALARSHLTPRRERKGVPAAARGKKPMRIDAGRSLCLALVLAVLHAGRRRPSLQIVLAGREPLPVLPRPGRYASAPRDLGRACRRPSARHPVQSAERAAERAPSRRLERHHVHQDLLGPGAQPLCLPRAARLSQPQEPYDPGALEGLDDAQTVDCSWLTSPQGSSRSAQQGGDAALRHARAARGALPQRRLDQRRDRRQPGGGDGRARHRPVHRRHGRQLRLRRGQPRRAGALLAGPHHRLRRRHQQAPLTRLSGPHRRLAGDRRQEIHRGERALAGPGLPPLALLAPAAGRAAARHRGPAPRRDVRRLRLLGRGDDVRPLPRLQGQRVGAQPARTCRRSRPSPRPSAAARVRATTTCRRPITSTAGSPSSRAGWCSRSAMRSARARSTCCSSRSAATTSASPGWSPTPCWPTSRSCAGSAAGSARCTASPRPAPSSMRSTTG